MMNMDNYVEIRLEESTCNICGIDFRLELPPPQRGLIIEQGPRLEYEAMIEQAKQYCPHCLMAVQVKAVYNQALFQRWGVIPVA